MILKGICTVTTALMIGFMMSGCSSDTTNSSSVGEKTSSAVSQSESESSEIADAKAILSQISDDKLDGSAFYGDETFSSNCKKLYGAEEGTFSGGGIIYATSGGYADEVSMLKTADGTSAKKYLDARLESRMTTFKNYNPDEVKKLEASEIFQCGDWWVLVISDNHEKIADQIKTIIYG